MHATICPNTWKRTGALHIRLCCRPLSQIISNRCALIRCMGHAVRYTGHADHYRCTATNDQENQPAKESIIIIIITPEVIRLITSIRATTSAFRFTRPVQGLAPIVFAIAIRPPPGAEMFYRMIPGRGRIQDTIVACTGKVSLTETLRSWPLNLEVLLYRLS